MWRAWLTPNGFQAYHNEIHDYYARHKITPEQRWKSLLRCKQPVSEMVTRDTPRLYYMKNRDARASARQNRGGTIPDCDATMPV